MEMEFFRNKKTAFVLSGGVIKAGAWHLGVALALEELGFVFKSNNTQGEHQLEIGTYVGSSAGSFINAYLASGVRPHQVVDSFLKKSTTSKPRAISYKDLFTIKRPSVGKTIWSKLDPLSDSPLLLRTFMSPLLKIGGLFSTEGLVKYLKREVLLSNSYDDYAADLFTVATHLDHSRKLIFGKYKYPNPRHDVTSVYKTGYPIGETVGASMSVPFIYTPYPLKTPDTDIVKYYIDGEIRETLSTHIATDNGCENIISSWTHTPYHYQEEIGSLVNYGLPIICIQAIHLMIEKKIIDSRSRKKTARDVINSLDLVLKENKIPDQKRKKILELMERKLNYNPKVNFIDIFPKHEDYKIFFKNYFSLDPEKAKIIVTAGYNRTMEVIQKFSGND
jgi:predicted acylesterase/phospholipase RssA